MVRSTRTFVVVGAVVVAALLAASQAEACWGWGCCQPVSYYTPYCASCCSPCYCYTPCCYTSCCYTSCCDYGCGCWYLGCRPGPIRRALFGPYRWYYSAGCCYDCCYCGSCCDTYETSCCGAATTTTTTTTQQPTVAPPQQATAEPAPALPTTPAAPPAEPAPSAAPPAGVSLPTTSTLPTRENSGLLTVWVPANAKVFVNGKETTTKGTRRRYVSFGLQPGLTYKYEVRAELVRKGMIAEETKTVYLTAGAMEGVAFGFNREPVNRVAAQP